MKAMVVLSGGQDSVTSLFWARARFQEVEAISFDYGQRHRRELIAASQIAEDNNIPHEVIDLMGYGKLAKSALTDKSVEVNATGGLNGLPSTFTPGRNLVFLSVAASAAISRGIHALVTGVCQTDYSGYPDCRRETMDALEHAIRLGNDVPDFAIHTPLMYLTKAQTVMLAANLGDECWIALRESVTCYHGMVPGCGTCPACELRAKGFQEAGLKDPAFCK